jgi:hypothetical protein
MNVEIQQRACEYL